MPLFFSIELNIIVPLKNRVRLKVGCLLGASYKEKISRKKKNFASLNSLKKGVGSGSA
jgi:hypothetical protein